VYSTSSLCTILLSISLLNCHKPIITCSHQQSLSLLFFLPHFPAPQTSTYSSNLLELPLLALLPPAAFWLALLLAFHKSPVLLLEMPPGWMSLFWLGAALAAASWADR
jgi:hypothetical protein